MNIQRECFAVLAAGVVAGASGIALAVPAHAAPVPKCGGKAATIVGTPKTDKLVGTPGADVIWGGGGADLIDGRGGNDVLCGASGADRLVGGPGKDALHGGWDLVVTDRGGTYSIGDRLDGGPGNDVLAPGKDPRRTDYVSLPNTVDYSGSGRGIVASFDGDRGTVRGQGTDTLRWHAEARLIGSTHDDRIDGSDRADFLFGHEGNDTIRGHGGNDEIGDGATYTVDLPDAPPPTNDNDLLDGGSGNDQLTGRKGRDRLFGRGGTDRLVTTKNGGDELRGGPGRDQLEGPFDRPKGGVMDGGSGYDAVEVKFRPQLSGPTSLDLPHKALTRGASRMGILGADEIVLTGNYNRLTFFGTPQRDYVSVYGKGPVKAWFKGGNDVIFSGAGNDVLNMGAGRDRASGMVGRDTCVSAELRESCEIVKP